MRKLSLTLLLLTFVIFVLALDELEEIVVFSVPEDSLHFLSKIIPIHPVFDMTQDGKSDIFLRYGGMDFDQQSIIAFYGTEYPDSLFDDRVPIPSGGVCPSYGGDLNGDGYNDLVVPVVQTEIQYLYIFFGYDNFVLDFNNPDFVLVTSDFAPDTFGLKWRGQNTGVDFNGDGFDDLFGSGWGPGYFFWGRVDIFLGSESFDTEVDYYMTGDIGDFLGGQAVAGDINGDGFDDIIVSRDCGLSGFQYEIYLGGDPFNLDVDFIIENQQYALSIPIMDGDFNNDGFNDLVLNDSIYFGGNNFDVVPDLYLTNTNQYNNAISVFYCDINNDTISDISYSDGFNLYFLFGSSNADNIIDLTLTGEGSNFAEYACNINDFNGDGNNDILVGLGSPDNRAAVYTMENLVAIEEDTIIEPNHLDLHNYPNPFSNSTSSRNMGTHICFSLKEKSNIEIVIYNSIGQRVKTLIRDNFEAGEQRVFWNGKGKNNKNVATGIYLYQLNVNGRTINTKKCAILK
jgi:hypothetical protein